ncbi:hypothetical protein [Sabulibacter ruber]|uniref:hypothetical protein n=1 Tax=Sabulibacter ruber TaxID=2811901 RepID=UPI001A96F223|nr:hypothetical protein [Sabulibacter ruber]
MQLITNKEKNAALALLLLSILPQLFLTFQVLPGGFSYSIIPGWHTPIFPPFFVYSLIAPTVAIVIIGAYTLLKLLYLGVRISFKK